MHFFSNIHIETLKQAITYPGNILLTGSCFTEHIGNHLADVKFNVLQNPNGILFNPVSVCSSLVSYIENRVYIEDDLFYFNECWHSWQHHSRFSNPDKETCLHLINISQANAHKFLKNAQWLIITLGSSFAYKLESNDKAINKHTVDGFVANCHKLPASQFTKQLLPIDYIQFLLEDTVKRVLNYNPGIKIILTISPVRHLRDGVTENNRSKARLIEATHNIVEKYEALYYFPSYELLIDVLRDYRFYDIDLVHPNYAATNFVLEKFSEHFISNKSQELIDEIRKIFMAYNHKPFNQNSQLHKRFLQQHYEKVLKLKDQYQFLDFEKEIKYFGTSFND